jgi:hypothetical protein
MRGILQSLVDAIEGWRDILRPSYVDENLETLGNRYGILRRCDIEYTGLQ